jgi:hypothetical protein
VVKRGEKMKRVLYPLMLVLLSSFAWAQTTGLMHYKSGSSGGSGILMLLYFTVGCLIFSVVFWLTHNWLVKNKR